MKEKGSPQKRLDVQSMLARIAERGFWLVDGNLCAVQAPLSAPGRRGLSCGKDQHAVRLRMV